MQKFVTSICSQEAKLDLFSWFHEKSNLISNSLHHECYNLLISRKKMATLTARIHLISRKKTPQFQNLVAIHFTGKNA